MMTMLVTTMETCSQSIPVRVALVVILYVLCSQSNMLVTEFRRMTSPQDSALLQRKRRNEML
jgi:hypothetical protein